VDQATHNKIVSFIWGIADDVLRDLFKRGKYPDVILPMCVIRRMDTVLEPTKQKVLDTKKMLDSARITERNVSTTLRQRQRCYLWSASGVMSVLDSRIGSTHRSSEVTIVDPGASWGAVFSTGGLIHTAWGSSAGLGRPFTNRSW
jgi:hypothetical protein